MKVERFYGEYPDDAVVVRFNNGISFAKMKDSHGAEYLCDVKG